MTETFKDRVLQSRLKADAEQQQRTDDLVQAARVTALEKAASLSVVFQQEFGAIPEHNALEVASGIFLPCVYIPQSGEPFTHGADGWQHVGHTARGTYYIEPDLDPVTDLAGFSYLFDSI